MNLATLTGFASLFYGREDAWFDSNQSQCRWERVSLMHFHNHLWGEQEIGTYPVLDSCTARWSCIDIDEDDYEAATSVQDVWSYFEVQSFIERSRSKGFHIWVFMSDWVSATLLRFAGLYVVHIAGLPSDTEVNPKQISVLGLKPPRRAPHWIRHGIGNTVRLPYSAQANPGRMAVLPLSGPESPARGPMDVGSFVALATQRRAAQGALLAPAQRWRAMESAREAERQATIDRIGTGRLSPTTQEAWRILNGERLVGSGERDNQFYTIANMLRGQGVDYSVAQGLVERAYYEQVEDKQGFSVEDALKKLERVYR